MAVEWKVDKNPNAYREISKEEHENILNKGALFPTPTYYNDGRYYAMNCECHTLIWLCAICIHIPEITEDNYREVYRRISIHEKLFGAFMYNYNPQKDVKTERFFDLQMVKSNIGLKTNGSWLDKKEWAYSIMERIADDIKSSK